jgi:hypothetical protein
MSRLLVGALTFSLFAALWCPGSTEAQVYQTQGTRRGAVIGGIIGGVIGANNDRPLAGIAAGAVVGGLLGREVGRQRDTQFYQQSYYGPYGQPYYQGQSFRSTTTYQDPRFRNYPIYNVPQQNFYGPRSYQLPPQQPRIIRYGW